MEMLERVEIPVTRVSPGREGESVTKLQTDHARLGDPQLLSHQCGHSSALPCNSVAAGTLQSGDCILSSNSTYYDVYTFQGAAGATVTIDMMSSAFDTYLWLYTPAGTLATQDDDSGDGLNSRIIFTLTASGTWTIRANAFSSSGSGPYNISVFGAGCVVTCPPPAAAMTCGSTVNGDLATNDCADGIGAKYDYYSFAGVAGQRVTIDMISTAFDTYLFLLTPGGAVYTQDDDSGDGLNSRITTVLNATGTWTIMTSSFSSGVTGPYTLQLACSLAKDDFNGDGKDDVIWRHTTGQNAFWFLNGAGVAGGGQTNTVSDTNWQLAGTGDFNGDGHPDILWHHDPTGTNSVWFMNGAAYSSQTTMANAPAPWHPAGAADFDGNGTTDVVWRNFVSGENSIWFMNGVNFVSGGSINPVADLNWRLIAAGDVNGDGRGDLLWWHHPTGNLTVWLMNGLTANGVYVGQVADTLWRPSALADANGDGRADVIWHHANAGSVAVWFLNGATVTGGGFIGGVADTSWRIVGAK